MDISAWSYMTGDVKGEVAEHTVHFMGLLHGTNNGKQTRSIFRNDEQCFQEKKNSCWFISGRRNNDKIKIRTFSLKDVSGCE